MVENVLAEADIKVKVHALIPYLLSNKVLALGKMCRVMTRGE